VVDFGEYKVFGRISGDIADSEIKGGMELKVVVNSFPMVSSTTFLKRHSFYV
jgi:hypothetical protein